jgi:hypothetical protein
MGLNDLDTDTAKAKMGYVHDASLITGTKGGGSRFFDYRLKKPENYVTAMNKSEGEDGHVSWEDTKSSAYKNAISTSQNIGSMGNLAINLAIYFTNVKQYTVSTATITAIIAEVLASEELDAGLRKALLNEAGFRNASKSGVDNFPPSEGASIRKLVADTVRHTLPFHQHAYERVTQLLYDYIQSHVKKKQQIA